MPKTVPLIPMKEQIERIQSIYSRAAERIVGILSGLDPASFTSLEHGRALRDVQAAVDVLNIQVRSWAPGAIKAAYGESQAVARTRLELIGAKASRRYNPARRDKKIAALTKTILTDYWKANRTIEKTARQYLSVMSQASAGVKKVEQAQFFDAAEVKDFIRRTVAGVLGAVTKYNAGTAHLTSKDLAAKIRAKLLEKIGGGDFITVNGRDYNLKSYAELVARTRMRESQTDATIEACREYDNDLVQFSKHDNPCEICAQYEGNVYSLSGDNPDYEKLPDEAYCPVHPRCVLPGTRCKAPGGIIAGLRTWYDGQAVEFVLAGGARVSVTVNHMFPTLYGFAPAYLLREGDDIFYCPDAEGMISVNPDDDREPSLIEEIVGSLAKTSGMVSARVPMSAEYLHGDGRFCNGNIDVIGAYGFLLNARQSARAEGFGANGLNGADIDVVGLTSKGNFASMLKSLAFASDGVMGGRRTPSAFFLARSGGGDSLPFGGASQSDAVPLQYSTDGHISVPALSGQVNGRSSGLVQAHYFSIGQGAGKPVSPEADFANGLAFNPGISEHSTDGIRVHLNALRDFTKQHSGMIHLDKIVKVNIFPFHGHVYDLHTKDSLYTCNGIVSSNCEHTLNPTSENALAWRNA
jgi:hypothetical protein